MKHPGPLVSLRCLLGAIALAAGVCAAQDRAPAHAGRVVADRWYEVWMAGARAGWAHELVVEDGDEVRTRTVSRLVLGRAEESTEIRSETEFVETPEGRPVELRVVQHMGGTPLRTTYRFDDDGVEAVSGQNGAEHTTRLPAPEGEWLPPRAAARYLAQRLASGAREVTVRTIEATDGMVVSTTTRTALTPDTVEIDGRETECVRANVRTTTGPITMEGREWIADDGATLRLELRVGSVEIRQVATTRERALADFDPPEIMVSTFVSPDRPVPDPRRASRAVYRLSMEEGRLPALPESGAQRVEPEGPRAARVVVETRNPRPAEAVERDAHLARTTYADTADRVIRSLTDRALAGAGRDEAGRAETLRRFVHTHIREKDLGTAFATASEVARSRQGDCSEHGVLLAAMLRVAGIPSRVAVGLVYLERFGDQRDVFGYHMWTQALLETPDGPAWIDLDPTMPPGFPFDATHIALGVSDLADGQTVSALAAVAPLLGSLRIEVEEVE